jgi:hypothetical protein
MVDRHLAGRRNGSADGAARLVHDGGLAGRGQADEGPEGPPRHASPGVPAHEQ